LHLVQVDHQEFDFDAVGQAVAKAVGIFLGDLYRFVILILVEEFLEFFEFWFAGLITKMGGTEGNVGSRDVFFLNIVANIFFKLGLAD
jgi:hypothetical protein